jgi:hypothetical protein
MSNMGNMGNMSNMGNMNFIVTGKKLTLKDREPPPLVVNRNIASEKERNRVKKLKERQQQSPTDNKIRVASMNIGSFMGQKTVPDQSETPFIMNVCANNYNNSEKKCYKNTLKVINQLFDKDISLMGLQEYRFKDHEEPLFTMAIKVNTNTEVKEIVKNFNNENFNNENFKSSMEPKIPKMYTVIFDNIGLSDLFEMENINAKYVGVGGAIESDNKKYYEGILTVIDTKKLGKVIKSIVFNLVDTDVRPCLIVVTDKYIIINLHNGQPDKILDNTNKEKYNKAEITDKITAAVKSMQVEDKKKLLEKYYSKYDSNETDKLVKNILLDDEILSGELKSIIEENLKSLENNDKKPYLIVGDFNDLGGGMKKIFNKLNDDEIRWNDDIDTCCYYEKYETDINKVKNINCNYIDNSEYLYKQTGIKDGNNIFKYMKRGKNSFKNQTLDYEYQGQGDYIAASSSITKEIKPSYIELDVSDNLMLVDANRKKKLNADEIEIKPLSDHKYIYAELELISTGGIKTKKHKRSDKNYRRSCKKHKRSVKKDKRSGEKCRRSCKKYRKKYRRSVKKHRKLVKKQLQ